MKYEHLLKQHHLKATPQRIAIIDLMEHAGHISIDELYRSIRKSFSSISLATLYKNIHSMMEAALIREVKIPGHKARYEIEKGSHTHILCKACGDLKDIPVDPVSLVDSGGLDTGRYQVDDVSLLLCGTCPECQER